MAIDALMTIFSSSGAGALIGGVFGWLGKREDRKTRAADQNYELSKIEATSRADTEVSNAHSFEESQKTKSSFGDGLKSAMRPLITGALMYMVFQILMQLEELTGGIASFPPEDAARLYRDIVLNIVSLAATAISWWFASRPSAIRLQ